MSSWRLEAATQQAHRREVNESIENASRGPCQDPNGVDFRCECGDSDCTRTISLFLPEYETVRANPTHFVIATNHEDPCVEIIISETRRFAVIATIVGEASKVALRTDPRALHPAGA